MGIFDIIELKNHCNAIGEYLLFLDAHPSDLDKVSIFMMDHFKKMCALLDKMENNS